MKNEKRDGYHKTEVGWIPTEWGCDRLLEHTSKIGSGVTPTGGEAVYESHGIPFIRSQNILIGEFTKKGLAYIPSDVHDEMQNSKVIPGDVLYNITGASIGRCCLFPQDLKEANVNQHVCIIRPTRELTADFLMQVLNSSLGERQLYQSQAGGGRQGLNYKNLGAFYMPFPSFDEQLKISQILSTWDRAIERVQRLIEAKQRQKKGLMQGLLTGKLRFPEFGEPVDTEGDLPSGWNKTKLKNVADIIVSNVDKLTNENESDVLLCNYMDVYSNEYITSKIVFMRATASQPEISKYRLVRGDVLLTKDSETSEDIASTAVLMEDIDDLICGYHLAILRPKKDLVNPVFLSKHLSFGNAHKHFVTHANGVTRYGLSLSSVINTPIFLPCLDEQTKIADLIMEIDREITIYSQILEMYTHQKKGLMQKLLTGEIRVKVG